MQTIQQWGHETCPQNFYHFLAHTTRATREDEGVIKGVWADVCVVLILLKMNPEQVSISFSQILSDSEWLRPCEWFFLFLKKQTTKTTSIRAKRVFSNKFILLICARADQCPYPVLDSSYSILRILQILIKRKVFRSSFN